jgi:hypothetical protein
LSVFVRYNPVNLAVGKSSLNFMIGGGISTPLGDYAVDEGLQSILAIGNRATSVNGLAIAQFQTPSGLFLTTQAGYSLRSGEVPNAVLGEIKAGYAGAKFYVDAWYADRFPPVVSTSWARALRAFSRPLTSVSPGPESPFLLRWAAALVCPQAQAATSMAATSARPPVSPAG